jgi:hypothetical protein
LQGPRAWIAKHPRPGTRASMVRAHASRTRIVTAGRCAMEQRTVAARVVRTPRAPKDAAPPRVFAPQEPTARPAARRELASIARRRRPGTHASPPAIADATPEMIAPKDRLATRRPIRAPRPARRAPHATARVAMADHARATAPGTQTENTASAWAMTSNAGAFRKPSALRS